MAEEMSCKECQKLKEIIQGMIALTDEPHYSTNGRELDRLFQARTIGTQVLFSMPGNTKGPNGPL